MRDLAVLALFLVCAQPLAAQANGLHAGARVRAVLGERHNTDQRTGVLIAYAADSLHVAVDGSADTAAVAVAGIRELYVSRGRRSRSESAGRGALVGAALGAFAGLAISDDCGSDGEGFCVFDRATTVPEYAFIGLLGGASLGAMFGGGERWHRVAVPSGIALSPHGRRGVALTVSLRH